MMMMTITRINYDDDDDDDDDDGGAGYAQIGLNNPKHSSLNHHS